ncbi:MAG: hypothetical protein HC849_15800 [Oscillatoriales cyanobacterium RU_3_3]|nr:hypothetical protein [Oscillatoriales cyanobacterium RU_3_3]
MNRNFSSKLEIKLGKKWAIAGIKNLPANNFFFRGSYVSARADLEETGSNSNGLSDLESQKPLGTVAICNLCELD